MPALTSAASTSAWPAMSATLTLALLAALPNACSTRDLMKRSISSVVIVELVPTTSLKNIEGSATRKL